MTIAKSIGDIETDTYWADVTSALVDICGLQQQDALAEVGEARADLSSLSEWGQLLAHHDSVPQAAEDIWKQSRDSRIRDDESTRVRQELLEWYTERMRQRGLL